MHCKILQNTDYMRTRNGLNGYIPSQEELPPDAQRRRRRPCLGTDLRLNESPLLRVSLHISCVFRIKSSTISNSASSEIPNLCSKSLLGDAIELAIRVVLWPPTGGPVRSIVERAQENETARLQTLGWHSRHNVGMSGSRASGGPFPIQIRVMCEFWQ